VTFWTAVVVIVAIGCFTELMKTRYRARHGITTDKQGNESSMARPDPALQREVQELRERIRVLERIATEANTTAALESRRVADEIEALRDRQTT
jgi:hypothetical protein